MRFVDRQRIGTAGRNVARIGVEVVAAPLVRDESFKSLTLIAPVTQPVAGKAPINEQSPRRDGNEGDAGPYKPLRLLPETAK